MKRVIWWLVGGVAAILFVWGASHELMNRQRLQSVKPQHDRTATVFVGGYGSTPHAFDRMSMRWEAAGIAKRAVVIKVDHSGKLHVTGNDQWQDNPVVQVAFADNKDPRVQIKTFPKIMHWLRVNRQVTHINLVTHSMGGVVAYSYLVNDQHQLQPRVNKWVAIASPFERLNRPEAFVKTYNRLLSRANQLPTNLEIMAVGGNVWGTGTDTEVSVKGVRALRPIVAPHIAHFEEHILWGSPLTVQHSALRTNPEVTWRVAKFLFE